MKKECAEEGVNIGGISYPKKYKNEIKKQFIAHLLIVVSDFLLEFIKFIFLF
ncbi:hypothetical protein OCK72_09585 [Fusobacterium simiae]|uniref:Uncharacterized protein n=1 Tax=Fusobacterium simiae TaxID=855 RepID=A0ABT4DJV0_FUSSI|nr:hypothetical protein [Fusobacterium simiae]MCY7008877.1 hypothetical protein [Fusobacterium simiae]